MYTTSLGNIFTDLFTFGDTGATVFPDWMVSRRDEGVYLAFVASANAGTDPITISQGTANALIGELNYWAARVGETAPTRSDLTSERRTRAVNLVVDAARRDPMAMSNATAKNIARLIGSMKDVVLAAVRANPAALPPASRNINPDTVQRPEEGTPWGLIAGVGGGVVALGLIGVVVWRMLRGRKGRRRR